MNCNQFYQFHTNMGCALQMGPMRILKRTCRSCTENPKRNFFMTISFDKHIAKSLRAGMLVAFASALVSACGGLDQSDSTVSSLANNGSGGASPNCSVYTAISGFPTSTPTRYKSDAQCNTQYQNANSYLAAAVQSCQSGSTSGAQQYYSYYKQLVPYVQSICP